MGKRFKNPLRPLAVYIDLTVVDPVKTAAAVILQRRHAIDLKTPAKPATSVRQPAALMDHRKFRKLQDAREQARQHIAIAELLERKDSAGDRPAARSTFHTATFHTATFRPVPCFPAIAANGRQSSEGSNSRPVLYLVKR